MPTTEDCMRCINPCPQARLAHETAKGRMYATNELLSYVKKVESGQLVEVVRCRECKHSRPLNRTEPLELTFMDGCVWCEEHADGMFENDFCSYGERREGDGDA